MILNEKKLLLRCRGFGLGVQLWICPGLGSGYLKTQCCPRLKCRLQPTHAEPSYWNVPQGIHFDTWSSFLHVLHANSRVEKPKVLFGIWTRGDNFQLDNLNASALSLRKPNPKHLVIRGSPCL